MAIQTLIRVQIGYNHMVVPYTPERAIALADFIGNCVPCTADWRGKITASNPDDFEIVYHVERAEMPVYVVPQSEPETNENESTED